MGNHGSRGKATTRFKMKRHTGHFGGTFSKKSFAGRPAEIVQSQNRLPTNQKGRQATGFAYKLQTNEWELHTISFPFLTLKKAPSPRLQRKKYKHCHRSDPFPGQGDLALRYLGFGAKASHEELQSCETLLKMSLTEAGGLVMAS